MITSENNEQMSITEAKNTNAASTSFSIINSTGVAIIDKALKSFRSKNKLLKRKRMLTDVLYIDRAANLESFISSKVNFHVS